MSMINRFCLKIFPLPTILLLLQMAATLAILYPLLAMGRLTFKLWRWQRCRQLAGISVLYTANTAFALFGLRTLNLPMYTAIKRLTPMLILILKALWKQRWPPPRITMSVSLVVLGCVVAGVGDLSFDVVAYGFAFSSVIMQALYLLLVEFQGDDARTSTSELLWYNAITSLPLLAALTAASGDFHALPAAWFKAQAAHGQAYFYCMVTATATLGCLLNFSLFLCTLHNTALTTTIVGVLRGVVTILLGFAFDTVKFSLLNVTGIAINTCGGVWYTAIKFSEKHGSSGGSGSGLGKQVSSSPSPAAATSAAAAGGMQYTHLSGSEATLAARRAGGTAAAAAAGGDVEAGGDHHHHHSSKQGHSF